MLRTRKKIILNIFFLLLLVFSCSKDSRRINYALNGGIGGTGIFGEDNGIGGTGIIGTISGYGSIIVNGFTIDYEPNQIVKSQNKNKLASELSIGQLVAVEAIFINDKFIAKNIFEQIALLGKVDAVNLTNREITVEGEKVLILPNTIGNSLDINSLKVGTNISIHGLRDDERLYSSHISLTSPNNAPFVTGTVTSIKDDMIMIDNNRSFLISSDNTLNLKKGDFIKIDLKKEFDNFITSSEVVKIYGQMFDGRVNRIAIEGFYYDEVLNNVKKNLSRKIIFETIKGNKLTTNRIISLKKDEWQNLFLKDIFKNSNRKIKFDKKTIQLKNQLKYKKNTQNMQNNHRREHLNHDIIEKGNGGQGNSGGGQGNSGGGQGNSGGEQGNSGGGQGGGRR